MNRTATSFLVAALTLIYFDGVAQAQDNKQGTSAQSSTVANSAQQLTLKEREFADKLLKDTENGVFASVKDLSPAQLSFKAAPDKWSVEECVKHIAAAEESLWAMVATSLQQAPNPESRKDIKFSDQDLISAVEDRSHKSKTFEALEPANSPYKTTADALTAFKLNREKLIDFVKHTKLDLRNHVSVLPIGTYDAYQFIMLIAAHSNRHTQQIDEVKNGVNFPAKR